MPSSRARWRRIRVECAIVDHVPHFVIDDENLENSHAALVTGLAAMSQPTGFITWRFAQLRRLELERAQFRFAQLGRLLCNSGRVA